MGGLHIRETVKINVSMPGKRIEPRLTSVPQMEGTENTFNEEKVRRSPSKKSKKGGNLGKESSAVNGV